MSRKYGVPTRCALTACTASTLDAAVTAEMTRSTPRTASAAELAQRTPAAWAASLSLPPAACGNRMSHAVIVATPASRNPAAMAWPASPKPINAIDGLPFGMAAIPLCRSARMMAGSARCLQRCARPIGCAKQNAQGGVFVMPLTAAQITSRRRFIQFLAASPLFAGTSLSAFAEEPYPERPADPFVWAPRDYDHLIASPKEALDVFDFESAMHKNVPPAHFGYMASGVDDDVTLRANRAGFLKFQLRPRRLVDVSKIDVSTEILGQKYQTPIIIDPTGGHKAYHPDGEEGVARAAKIGDHLMILSTQASTSVADVIAARGRPIWSQLYATNKFEVAKHHVESMERQGSIAIAVTVDRNGGRNQEVALRMRRLDTRECSGCHDRSSLQADSRDKPMYDGTDLSGLKNIQSSAMSWDYIKRLRDLTKMKMVLKGILAWEDAKIAARTGIDAIIVSNHGGRADEAGRSTIETLPEVIQVAGNMPVLIDSGFRRGTDIVKALCMGAKGVAVGRPYLWGLGAFGQPGVERVLDILRTELMVAMQQIGAPSLKQLVPAMVRRA